MFFEFDLLQQQFIIATTTQTKYFDKKIIKLAFYVNRQSKT